MGVEVVIKTRKRFAGKTAVVTGAAQGIGKAVALRLAAEGATVALIDRSPFVEKVRKEIVAKRGKSAVFLADLEHADECRKAIEEAGAVSGRIDILVNNVGGTIWVKPFEQYRVEEITAEINRSLFPTLWCCHAVLPTMIAQGAGSIVNVSSVATRGLYRVPYSAAKGGINAITTCLAFENAHREIRVNGVAPGGTNAEPREIPRNTEKMSKDEEQWYQEMVDQSIGFTFMKRFGTPNDQADAILFLSSNEAEYITGLTIPVAGGDLG